MQNAHLLLSERDKSIDQRYGLSLDESIALYEQTVSVTSEIFESAVVILVIGEQFRSWSNIDDSAILPAMSQGLMEWLAKTNTIQLLPDASQFSELLPFFKPPIMDQLAQLCSVPIMLEDTSPIGGLFVCWRESTVVPRAYEAVLRLIGKDLVSQLKLTKQNTDLTYLTELYTLITETNQDLIFAKDKEFRLVIANQNFLELYPPEMRDKVIGYTTLESYPPEEVEKFLANDVAAFKLGRSDVIETITFPSGEVRIINTVKTRFETTAGEPFILCVSHNITEKERLIERLKKSNSDLDEFAYVASHDLKSPLNAIKRLVSFIEEDSADDLDGMSKKHFSMIKGRADRMLKLLSDLLSFAQIGRESQQFEFINLKNITENCTELLDIPAQFILEVQDKDVVLPRVPLELIIVNLVSNAIKHHDKPMGKVVVNCIETSAYYLIDVIDDGPGIHDGMFEKIFEKFQTLKPRDQVEGSGLGLSMVKKTIEHYGGTIAVKSDGVRGTQFSLKWPKEHSEVTK